MSWVKSASVVRALKQNLQEVEQQAHNLFELISRDPSLSEASSPAAVVAAIPSKQNITESGLLDRPIASSISSNTAPYETTASIAIAAASALAANGNSLATGSASITNVFISSSTAAASTTTTTTTTIGNTTTTTTTTNAGIAQPPLASSFLGLLRTHVTDSIQQANESIDCLAKMDEITEVHQPTIENVRKLVDTIHEQVSQLSHCYLMSKSPTANVTFANGRIDMSSKGKDALSLYQMSTLQFAEESMNLLAAKIMDEDVISLKNQPADHKPAWSLSNPPPAKQKCNASLSRKTLMEQKKVVLTLMKDSTAMSQQLEAILNVQAEVLQKVIDSSRR